jgi:hypothetical protein
LMWPRWKVEMVVWIEGQEDNHHGGVLGSHDA